MKLSTKETLKLAKALKLMTEAMALINSVEATNDKVKYDGNANILYSRLSGSISIVDNYLKD